MENKFLKKYSDIPVIRAFVQMVPYVGGAIDTILYEAGSRWRQERIETFIKGFSDSIENIIDKNQSLEKEIKTRIDSEEFYDLFINCTKESVATRHKEKIKYYSNILSNYTTAIIKKDDELDLILNVVSSLILNELLFLKELSENGGKISLHFINTSTIVNMNKLKNYIEENHTSYDRISNSVPSVCIIRNEAMFSISRLQNLLLIDSSQPNQFGGSIHYSWSKPMQSENGSIPYVKEIKISLTEFGNKILTWIRCQ